MTKALQKCHSTQLSEIAAPVGTPWLWTLAFSQHKDRTPTHGYEPTRLRWRRSPKAGDGNSQTICAYLSGKLSGLTFRKVLSAGRSGRI